MLSIFARKVSRLVMRKVPSSDPVRPMSEMITQITITGDQSTIKYFDSYLVNFEKSKAFFDSGDLPLAQRYARESLGELMKIDTLTPFKMRFIRQLSDLQSKVDQGISHQTTKNEFL
jgi:hypothetical protein